MRNFKLYVYNKRFTRLITSFDNKQTTEHNEPFSTYAEQLVEAENDQYTLTFSIMGYVYIDGRLQRNYWLDLLKMGARVRIDIDDNIEVQLIIKSVQPTLNKEGLSYTFTAQDEVSYLWAKHNLGYWYSTSERGSVQTIYEIANNVLIDNHLNGQWAVYDEEPVGDPNYANPLRSKPITLEVEDSNPYNIIIEACNTLNCFMRVDYKRRRISFYQKEYIPFSGYRYRSEVNMQSFSASYDCQDFSSIMHVVGGENEYGEIITLVPAMPIAVQNYILQTYSTIEGDEATDAQDIPRWLTPEDNPNDPKQALPDNIDWTEIASSIINSPNYIKYMLNDDKNSDGYTEEVQEINDFCTIANEVPHIGQFLLNLEYFSLSKLLTTENYNILVDLFNISMRNNNMWLKIYTPIKYQLEWAIMQKLNSMYNEASEYQAECQYIQQRVTAALTEENSTDQQVQADAMDSQTTYAELFKNIPSIEEKIVNSCTTETYGLFRNMTMLYGIQRDNNNSPSLWYIDTTTNEEKSNIPEIQSYLESRKYYKERTATAENQLKNVKTQIETYLAQPNADLNDPVYITLSQKRAGLEKNITDYKTLGDGWYIYFELPDDEGNYPPNTQTYFVTGLYDFLLELMQEQYIKAVQGGFLDNITNINTIIDYYEAQNDTLWQQIYNDYGDCIYETKYENTDELNSVSLYNQGILAFAKQKFPVPSYSVTGLDIGQLEPIGIPRLSIGSKIRVYNKYLNLNDGEVDNLSFQNNELIVTQITYDLRNAAKVTISVEKVQTYENIIEKLLLSVKK